MALVVLMGIVTNVRIVVFGNKSGKTRRRKLMKARLILLILCFACLFGGCSNKHEHPRITELGIYDITADNTHIEVSGAKTGMKGYEIVETETGIDVILHYDKEAK